LPLRQQPLQQRDEAMPRREAQQRRQAGQQQGLQCDQRGDARGRRAQHAQHGQIALAGAHRMQQRDPDRQARRDQQHDAEATQHVRAGADQPHQPRRLQRRRGGLQALLGIDPARQRHRRQRAAVAHQRQRDLAPVVVHVMGFAGVMLLMDLPDGGQVGQHEAVQHAARFSQYADDLERLFAMRAAAFGQAVAAGETVAGLEPRRARHLRAQHRLHRPRPQRTPLQPGAVQAEVVRRRAGNAETPQ
jgi:hypothetical protein